MSRRTARAANDRTSSFKPVNPGRKQVMADRTYAARTGDRQPVASRIHTALVIAAILAVSGYGLWFSRSSSPPPELVSARRDIIQEVYLPAVIYEWALLGLIWSGVRRTTGLRGLIGGNWKSIWQAVTDGFLGLAFWAGWYVIEKSVQYLLGPAHNIEIDYLFPRSGLESAFWILSAVSSGFCEEIVFRGYLLRQFAAWTGSVPFGVLLQAALFGAAHPLLGLRQMIVICVSAVLFALLALSRTSLRPGMVAHAWADIFGGMIVKGLPYK